MSDRDEPLDRSALVGLGYSAGEVAWLLARSDRQGLDGRPVLLRTELERLLPDLPGDPP